MKKHINTIIDGLKIIRSAIIGHVYGSEKELTSSFYRSITEPFQKILKDINLEKNAYSDILSWLRKKA